MIAHSDRLPPPTVPTTGVEPARPCGHYDLNVARLPNPPRRHWRRDPGRLSPWAFHAGPLRATGQVSPVGFEPTRPFEHDALNVARLPVPPR